MAPKAYLREVGLRDGLQLTKTILQTQQKLEWLRSEVLAGVRDYEITSFVPAKLVPQFADASEVAASAVQIPDVTISALVPNSKGAERAIASGVTHLNYVLSASNEHNLANVRRTTEESLADFEQVIASLRSHPDERFVIAGGIATAFGCTISGAVEEKRVVGIAARLAKAGAHQIIMADTVGYATPAQVTRLMKAVDREIGGRPIVAHFHDTRGTGLANVTAALEADVVRFDASLGGLGGCPFAPGATGNINMEDTAYLLESLGLDTGINIDALVALRSRIEAWLPGEGFNGKIALAGLPKTFSTMKSKAA